MPVFINLNVHFGYVQKKVDYYFKIIYDNINKNVKEEYL